MPTRTAAAATTPRLEPRTRSVAARRRLRVRAAPRVQLNPVRHGTSMRLALPPSAGRRPRRRASRIRRYRRSSAVRTSRRPERRPIRHGGTAPRPQRPAARAETAAPDPCETVPRPTTAGKQTKARARQPPPRRAPQRALVTPARPRVPQPPHQRQARVVPSTHLRSPQSSHPHTWPPSGPTTDCSPERPVRATDRARPPHESHAPNGIRTRATALKGPRPGPLVDGGACGQASRAARARRVLHSRCARREAAKR